MTDKKEINSINTEPCYERKLELIRPILKNLLLSKIKNYQDAEDLVQKTLIILFKKKDEYNGNRSFFSWAFTIALFQSKAYFLKSKRNREFSNNDSTKDSIEKKTPYYSLESKEFFHQRKHILKEINKNHLSDRERQFLKLYLDNEGKDHIISNMKLTNPRQYSVWKRRVVQKIKLHSPSYIIS